MSRCIGTVAGAMALYVVLGCAGEPAPARTPDVEFSPTDSATVLAMLGLAKVTSRDTVYDLGSGDGRIVVMAASRFGAHGVGVELDPILVRRSRRAADSAKVSALVEFREGDLFEADLASATVVTLYLLPELNLRLRPRLLGRLRPGARIVSHEFDMGDWPPDTTIEVGWSRVHLWTVPTPSNKD